MTATATAQVAEATAGAVGRIARVIGPVVDIEFPPDSIPEIYNALTTDITLGDVTTTITLEVAQHLGDDVVRAIALKPTDGLVRGQEVTDTGEAISVPVGDVTKGHVFNVIGEVLNGEAASSSRSPSAGPSTASPRPSTSSSPRRRCSRPASRSSTCSPRTCWVERSASSAVPASARRSSSRR